jgi:acyl-CoA reductase-like NAD-dependent aldehyde dehydrogenase
VNAAAPAAVVAGAVARARATQPAWAALLPRERARRLLPVKNRLLDRADTIAECVRAEVGKPRVEALLGEVLPSADVVQYWVEGIEELQQPVEVQLDGLAYPGKRGTTYREARGVVGLITPYNFPVALPLRTIVPALLSGNAVVFKPSEVTRRSGDVIAELFQGLLPDGILCVVQGAGDVGAALCSADVDLVVFTGSVSSGRKVAHACAERLVPCAVELGGKDAAIVLADADLERAANGIVWGGMMNAGQNCASVERVYVEKSVATAFASRLCTVAAALRRGIDVGSLSTSTQREIVSRQVKEAQESGAQILCGGNGIGEGLYYPPTVVRVSGDDSALMRDETFGPVLPIAVVDTAEEAVARANASRYGLTASVWTRNLKKAERIARQLRAGVVTINNHAFTGAIPAAPWSGHGETGWGITNSPLSLDALTRPRFVLVDRSHARRELWWYPYTAALEAVASAMATLRSSTQPLLERARALVALLRAMLRRKREL